MHDRRLISTNGNAVDESTIIKLQSHLRGTLVRPGDDGYDDARRLWNGCFDKRPDLIARCADSSDVVRTIEFARNHELTTAVRAGGHSLAGKSVSEGGVTIDLSLMKGVRVDPKQRVAYASAGLLLGEFDQATILHGLGTTMGTAPDTGMAGLTLGGGLGWLMGRCGLACDNLLAVEAVTADGRTLRASAQENSDLFWGVRGAGANLAVVTSFEFQLHPLGPVLGGTIAYPMANAARAMHSLQDLFDSMPDELQIIASGGVLAGQPAFSVTLCWSGDLESGEKALAPLRAITPIIRDSIAPIPYQAMQAMLAMPRGLKSYWRSGFMRELGGATIESIVANMERAPSPSSGFFIEPMHGAVCRVSPTDTAFAHRAPGYDFACMSVWQDSAMAEPSISWVRALGCDRT